MTPCYLYVCDVHKNHWPNRLSLDLTCKPTETRRLHGTTFTCTSFFPVRIDSSKRVSFYTIPAISDTSYVSGKQDEENITYMKSNSPGLDFRSGALKAPEKTCSH